jgi:1-acyl-sn-glycerol-3-phosphate acyltransferase
MRSTAAAARTEVALWKGSLRVGFRSAVFLGITLPLLGLHTLSVPLLRLLRLPARSWSARLQRIWARGVARILRMRIETDGNPPKPPFLLVTNHLSYIDVILIMSLLDAAFVAKADAASWPFFGGLCRTGGTIFLDRTRKRDLPRALQEIHTTLERGRSVVLFPEGTTSNGGEVLPFRSSLLQGAASHGVPVAHATLTYATDPPAPAARRAVCWWGNVTFLGHLVGLIMLPGFRAHIRFGSETVRDKDRKRLAASLEQRIRADFDPVQ